MRRLLLPLVLPLLLSAAPVAQAAPAWERANTSISCSDTEGSSPFYNGKSASTVYDSTFKLGHGVPAEFLDHYVPQGLGTWRNWLGKSDLLIQSGYNDATDRAAIVGMVPGGGTTKVAVLALPGKRQEPRYVNAHVGGVAIVGSWMFIAGPSKDGKPTVLRYGLEEAHKAMQTAGVLRAQKQIKLDVPAGFNASFLAPQGSSLWIGTFDKDHRNRMHRFAIGAKGGLKRVGGVNAWVQVPKKTQGLAVTKSHWVFSTSWTRGARSNVYVVRRGNKFLDGASKKNDLTCFAAPSMAEGITFSGGQAFLSFESGSFEYRGDPCDKPKIIEITCTRNIVTHLHRAPRAALLAMT